MDGEAVKQMAERFRHPHLVTPDARDVVAAPADWKVYDPAELIKAAPKASAFQVATLGAVRDYLTANRDDLDLGKVVVHVEGPNRVTIGGPLRERSRDRELYLTAETGDLVAGFLGKWMPLEEFVIGLQVRFCEAEQRDNLIRLFSNVSENGVKTSLDDGISQVLEARVGVVLRGDAAIKNPVTLQGFRTFRDIVQPVAPYVVRAKAVADTLPQVSLMEADGGAWRLTTIARVRDWLAENLPAGVAVLA
ncbi:MAG: hypothetical protein AB7O67_16705 [Vicinamibacterales bacterium]